MKHLGIPPDLVTYKVRSSFFSFLFLIIIVCVFCLSQYLVSMYGQRKHIEKVLDLVQEVKRTGLEPNEDLRAELLIAFVCALISLRS